MIKPTKGISDGDWANEPDLDELQAAYELLSSNQETALSQLRALADRGSRMSLLYISSHLAQKAKSNEDFDEIVSLSKRAADTKIPLFMYHLALFLHQSGRVGEGSDILNAPELDLFPPALNEKAILYREGIYLEKDLDKALALYKKAASMGHLFAQRGLASFYATGLAGAKKIPLGLWLLIAVFPYFVIEIIKVGPHSERLI